MGLSGCKEPPPKEEQEVGSFSIKERPAPTRQAAQAYFEEGLRYYTEGDLDRAISCFAEALKIDPEHTKARKMFVESLKKRAEEKEMVVKAKEPEAKAPKEEISITKEETPPPKEVVEVTKEVEHPGEVRQEEKEEPKEKLPPPEIEPPKEKIEEVSEEESRRFDLIRDLKRRGMLDEAIEEIKLLLDDFPKTLLADELVYLRAEIYFDKGEYKNAERDYTEIVDFYEESPLVYDAKVRIADTYLEQGEYDEALLRYMRLEKELRELAAKTPPTEEEKEKRVPSPTPKARLAARTQLGIAESYRHKKEYILALIEYYELIKTYSDPKARAHALYYIGYIYDFVDGVRDFRRAVAAYESVIEEYPESPWTPYARKRKAYIEENYL
jgi:tetratricopeptide (TPR) repeat protein